MFNIKNKNDLRIIRVVIRDDRIFESRIFVFRSSLPGCLNVKAREFSRCFFVDCTAISSC